jgi:regulator of protease activity HflC (stomatin/prohibitin superfamily)
MVFMLGCAEKTYKDSRQFENLVETTALSKDGKELITYSRNFYVFESKKDNLFDEKGFFISENTESEDLAEAIVRSGVRSVIRKYSLDSLLTLDKMELGREMEDFVHTIKVQNGTKDFDIRFNGILLEKITPKKGF